MDPISAAEIIINHSKRIVERVQTARTNRRKCEEVRKRVDNLQALAARIKKEPDRLLNRLIDNVELVMESADTTVAKYCNMNRAIQYLMASQVKAEFDEVNIGLDSVLQDLTAALSAEIRTGVHEVNLNVAELRKCVSRMKHTVVENLKGVKLEKAMAKRATEGPLRMQVPEHLVSLQDRVDKVESILQQKSTNVLALVGMGGVGKTTLARLVYNAVDDSKSFNRIGWVTVGQNASWSQCLQDIWALLVSSPPNVQFSNAEDVSTLLMNRLQETRVLLVLDDVWSAAILKKLMVATRNKQSRLLFTSRNVEVAKAVHAQVYRVGLLDENHSFELFCRWAFGVPEVPNNKKRFADCVQEMVLHCGQLPLALCVIGSMAAGYSSTLDWEFGVRKLRQSRPLGTVQDEILQVLEASFDELEDVQKSMFFCCIAYPEDCHLRVSDLVEHWLARQDLEGWEFDVDDWLIEGYAICGQLIDRSLLLLEIPRNWKRGAMKESFSDMFCYMHDVVREMGLHLAKEGVKDISRERLLFPKIQQLDRRTVMAKELSICDNSLDSWPQGLQLPLIESIISRDSGFSLFPSNILFGKNVLRALDMSRCPLQRLPIEISQLINLEVLRLDNCNRLKELPCEIGELKQLLFLSIRGCQGLKVLPESLGRLTKLHSLYIGCSAMPDLPTSIGELASLQKLELEGCTGLLSLPTTLADLSCLQLLKLSGSYQISKLPEGLGRMKELETLNLNGCSNLTELPEGICLLENLKTLILRQCSSLTYIPECVGLLSQLEKLDLSKCFRLVQIPNAIGSLDQLEMLDLHGCTNLERIPESLGSLDQLQVLTLSKCSHLKSIPDGVGLLGQMTSLNLDECWELGHIPDNAASWGPLEKLIMSNCSSLTHLPENLGLWTQLTVLDLTYCSSLKHLPESIGSLCRLRTLYLNNCSCLVQIPETVGSLCELKVLNMSDCAGLSDIPESVGSLQQLEVFTMRRCSSLTRIPDSMGSLIRLRTLNLRGCSRLSQIPESIGSLRQLKCLDLGDCCSLTHILEGLGSLTNLRILDMSGCSLLTHIPRRVGSLNALRMLFLTGCNSLTEIPDCFRGLTEFETLYLKGCKKLTQIPESVGSLSQLKTLDLKGCSNLTQLPESVGLLSQLEKLSLNNCHNLVQIPQSIGSLTQLKTLDLRGCSSLTDLPQSIKALARLN